MGVRLKSSPQALYPRLLLRLLQVQHLFHGRLVQVQDIPAGCAADSRLRRNAVIKSFAFRSPSDFDLGWFTLLLFTSTRLRTKSVDIYRQIGIAKLCISLA